MLHQRFLTVMILLAASAIPAHADELIWIEGEAAVSSTMRGHNWYNSVKTGELSGGKWLSHFADGPMPVASFEFDVEQAGEHDFWLRVNPVRTTLSVRLNGGDWNDVSLKKQEQNINIASDGKPDLRFIAWVKADSLLLKLGRNSLDVRFESENNRHGGLDCCVLSSGSFRPQGSRKPGQKTGLADPGTWAFEPDRDRFSSAALLDLSNLNDKPAGRSGRVRRSADGADFVDGTGQPLRFWAVNTSVQYRDDMDAVEEHAQWLAKRGVNMVRHHGHLAPGRGSKITDVNQQDIDAAWRLVAAMKKQGVYVTISPYWAVSVQPQPGWGLKDAGGQNLTGLLFFDRTLQDAYKGWLRALLTPNNPHTGIPLARDPAVAIFQIQNEDSLLFWTEGAIKSEQRHELGRRFGEWLIRKYGSIAAAGKAWGGRTHVDGDDFTGEIMMPQGIWHLTQSQNGPMAKRLNDQLAFYTGLMHEFNTEIARFLREDIGYDGLINAGNWRTADQARLLDAERYAYSANDVIGVNRYYTGGEHTNPTDKARSGYLISEGDVFSGESTLRQPWAFPLALRQVSGYPMIIPESAWVPPLRYQTEGPFLVAAYGALTGFDIFYWFATDQIGFGPPMGKWQLSSPAQMGMFPAAALMFRNGYVHRAQPSLVEYRSRTELWSRTPPLLPEEAGFDPNRDTGAPATQAEAARQGRLTPLTYLTGPVEVSFIDGKTKPADVTTLIDSRRQVVHSSTNELEWHYGNGVCVLNAPKAQGATGDLAKIRPIRLDTLTVVSRNEYASLLAVSMDGRDLDTSRRILIQVGTTARPHGWKTTPAGNGRERIVSLGSSPWNIDRADVEIQLNNRGVSKATALDANGIATGDVPLQKTSDGVALQFPPDVMYVILD